MLDIEVFFSIIVVYAMIVISPGPNFVLVTRYSLRRDTQGAMGLMFGFAIGATINACLTMFGIAAIIISVPAFGLLVSLLGGGFLVYLGFNAILRTVREQRLGPCRVICKDEEKCDIPDTPVASVLLPSVLKGIAVNLLNPKGIVFFIGLYAPLISKSNLTTKLSVLVAGFLIEIIWYLLIIFVLSRPQFRDAYEQANFSIDIVLGMLLCLVGVRVIFEATRFVGLM